MATTGTTAAIDDPAGDGSDRTTPRRELQLLVQSRIPVLFVETIEEERAERLLRDAAMACELPLYTWSLTEGLRMAGQPGHGTDDKTATPEGALRTILDLRASGLFILRDLGPHIAEPMVERLLRDIARMGGVTLAVLGPHVDIPEALRIDSASYTLPRPDVALIDAQARATLQQLQHRGTVVNELDEVGFRRLVDALRGLTLEEVDHVLTRLVYDDGKLTAADVTSALDYKGQLFASRGVLDLVTPDHGMQWVAGFANLKSWLHTRGQGFRPDAARYGVEPPKGVLLTGVPGCGKSFVVKAVATEWSMPLLRLDASALYGKFIGESEQNLRTSLQTAEALAPSILWIDEIEKGFGSSGPSDTDGGLAYRLLGTLATWMQEREAPVFIAATSNDITLLPPELTRQGRFDEIFFVDLPDAQQRAQMFAIQLSRRGRSWKLFDCNAMATASAGFSGSEIEQSLVNALYGAFAASRDLTTNDVLEEIHRTRPMSTVQPEKITRIRSWGALHARPA